MATLSAFQLLLIRTAGRTQMLTSGFKIISSFSLPFFLPSLTQHGHCTGVHVEGFKANFPGLNAAGVERLQRGRGMDGWSGWTNIPNKSERLVVNERGNWDTEETGRRRKEVKPLRQLRGRAVVGGQRSKRRQTLKAEEKRQNE